jgi:hypothetical protein
VSRTNFRTLASNRGAGWMLGDFWLVNAIQMLFLVEYQTFNSQAVLGTGNVNEVILQVVLTKTTAHIPLQGLQIFGVI